MYILRYPWISMDVHAYPGARRGSVMLGHAYHRNDQNQAKVKKASEWVFHFWLVFNKAAAECSSKRLKYILQEGSCAGVNKYFGWHPGNKYQVAHIPHALWSNFDSSEIVRGSICLIDKPIGGNSNDVAKNKNYQELFGEQASKILSVYEHRHDHAHSSDGVLLKKKL